MVQKKAFVIIFGLGYRSYESALETLKQERLDSRHETLCLNYLKYHKHSSMFPLNN